MRMTVSVMGGDKRFLYTAKRLRELGYTVLQYACGNDSCTFEQAVSASVVVLPLPASRDNVTLNAPLHNDSIKLCDIVSSLGKNQLLLGGITKIDYPDYYDYYNNEKLLYKNSVITAEGAIQIALDSLPRSIAQCRVLVVGYGRLGKALCKRLIGFECNLTVSARRHEHFAQISGLDINCVNTLELENAINNFDVIFNTVPQTVINKSALQSAKPEAIFIELASAPFGIDISAAKELCINLRLEPSLPSRCAPQSAGSIIADAVNDIILAV